MFFRGSLGRLGSAALFMRRVDAMSSISFREGWKDFRGSLARLPDLEEAERKAIFVESRCISNQSEKKQRWDRLLENQLYLEDMHSKLDPLPTQSVHYAALISEEVNLIKKIRSLSLDFDLCNKTYQENLKSISSVTNKCLDAQRNSEKQIFNVCTVATIVGLALGTLVAFTIFKAKDNISLNVGKNKDSYDDILDGMLWIRRQNDKLKKCIKEMWAVYDIHWGRSLISQLHDNDFEKGDFVSEVKLALEDIFAENEAVLKEMVVTEDAIFFLKQFKRLPELVFLIETNVVAERKGLWLTTLAYGVAAVVTPILLLFF